MFEVFESGSRISKKDYKERLPVLRAELLQTQFALQEAGIPLLIIVAGAEGAGKGEVVNRLNSWMDTRYIETSVFTEESDEEVSRPFFWRFWRKMPAAGQVGVFFGSWYTRPITRHVFGTMPADRFHAKMHRIRTMEQMLVDGGMLIVKCWLHVSRQEQHRRFKALEKDERTRWRVSDTDWRYHDRYDTFLNVSSSAIRHTDTAAAPWHIVSAENKNHARLTVLTLIREALDSALASARTGDKDGNVTDEKSRSGKKSAPPHPDDSPNARPRPSGAGSAAKGTARKGGGEKADLNKKKS